MQPIINPWIFYWAEVSEGIKKASAVFAVICVGLTIIILLSNIDNYDEDYKHRIFKYAICSTAAAVFFLLIYMFVPSEKTIYKMTVARYITEDNVAQGKEEIKELVDYIADKIEDTKSEGE